MSPARAWLLAIGGLLGANVLAMVVLATAASTRRAEVIPDYYERAVRYDDALAEAARSRALGWSAAVAFGPAALEVVVRDARGDALDGARVLVSGYHRARPAAAFARELDGDGDGRYRAAFPGRARGWYDLEVVVEHAGARFLAPASVEAP